MLTRGRQIVLLALLPMMAALTAPAGAQQTMFRPVAVVNDQAITGFDIQQRMQILSMFGAPAASQEALQNAALDALIEDRLKLQEGKRLGLEPTPELIAQARAEMAERMNISPEELTALFSNQQVTDMAVEDMIAAEAVWREVVRTRFARRIEPSEAEIQAELDLMTGREVTSYRLFEIGLPATGDGRTEAETRALAERLYQELASGGDFDAAVRRYSRAPSAQRGGEVGWVPERNLPRDLSAALASLEVGQVSRPLPVPGGISILKIVDSRVEQPESVDTTDPELRERVRRSLMNQQTARLSEGLLQELRRDALIEIR